MSSKDLHFYLSVCVKCLITIVVCFALTWSLYVKDIGRTVDELTRALPVIYKKHMQQYGMGTDQGEGTFTEDPGMLESNWWNSIQ